MKSIIIRIILAIVVSVACLSIALLSSCSAIVAPIADAIADEIFIDYPYLSEPIEEVWSRSSSFMYQGESGNYWKSPREMDRDRRGDCEDFAGWMIYHLGKDASLVRFLPTGKKDHHAIVFYHGMYIEPQKYGKTYTHDDVYQSPDVEQISYDAVMKLSTAMFTK